MHFDELELNLQINSLHVTSHCGTNTKIRALFYISEQLNCADYKWFLCFFLRFSLLYLGCLLGQVTFKLDIYFMHSEYGPESVERYKKSGLYLDFCTGKYSLTCLIFEMKRQQVAFSFLILYFFGDSH